MSKSIKRAKWHRASAHRRLAAALVVVIAVAMLLPQTFPASVRLATAWDAGVVFFLAWTWWVIQLCPPEGMRQTVLENDQGRVGVLLLVLAAIAASVAAIFFLLEKPQETGAALPPL